jgi:hypothetical protein
VLLSILPHPLRKRLRRFYVEAEGTLSPKELTVSPMTRRSRTSATTSASSPKRAPWSWSRRSRAAASVERFNEATSLVDEVPWVRAALGLGGEAA